MDDCHIELIYGLLISHKPKKVLEIGIGSSIVTNKILEAFDYNDIYPRITCVDNFIDWGNIPPINTSVYQNRYIVSNEKDFIENCNEKYDFIVSDADHEHTNEWFDKTFDLLEDNGILIYHDVTNYEYPNLFSIVVMCKEKGINYLLFNRSSLKNERCERGLLVIQKGQP
jgi:hypothetical protein